MLWTIELLMECDKHLLSTAEGHISHRTFCHKWLLHATALHHHKRLQLWVCAKFLKVTSAPWCLQGTELLINSLITLI